MLLDKKPNLTFVEIAAEWARELDEARRPGRPNRDEIFLGLLNAVWGGQLNDAVLTIEQAPRDDVDGQIYKPAPLRFTREMLDKVVLVQQGARRRYPAASRWEFRTSLKLEDYDPVSLSAYVEPLTISKEDFRRWCDEQGHPRPRFWFGEQTDARAWMELCDEENLPRRKIVDPKGDHVGRRQDEDRPLDKQKRTHDAQAEALLKKRIEGVLAKARAKWPDPQKRFGVNRMARALIAGQPKSKVEDFGQEAIRKILAGTYKPAKNRNISGLSSW